MGPPWRWTKSLSAARAAIGLPRAWSRPGPPEGKPLLESNGEDHGASERQKFKVLLVLNAGNGWVDGG